MSYLKGRVRPAGESSDEDEYAGYLSDTNDKPLLKAAPGINDQKRENERIFQLFLNGDLKEIITLLNEGFDVNKQLQDNWTPLLLTASIGKPDVAKELILKGADVNMHRDYYTPLMAAASCPESTSAYDNSLVIVQYLIKSNANAKAKTRKRITALMFAASSGNYAVVKELLPCSDKTAEDNQGWTALFWAVNSNKTEIVKLLLEEGLPYDKFDVRGNLPINYAKENDFTNIIEILPSLGEQGDGPFMFSEYGYHDFFDTGKMDFIQDTVTMLYGMKNEKNVQQFLINEIDLLKFLCLDDKNLESVGVVMPYERYRILSGLYRFHKHPFKTKALPIVGKSEPYSTLDAANTILSACRQFIVMNASLKYILRNMKDLNKLKDFKSKLEEIKGVTNKINHIMTKLNSQVIEWDHEIRPADLITKNSCKKIKSSKLKYFYVINILSLIIFVTWKKII